MADAEVHSCEAIDVEASMGVLCCFACALI